MGATTIEWTDWTVNPIRAKRRDGRGRSGHYCEKISPGCAHCYASQFQPRFGLPQFAGRPQRAERLAALELHLNEAVLASVVRRKKPTRIFWCDMTDLFGHWVPDEWIAACFFVMHATPWHTHQVLTKRAQRMKDWFELAAQFKHPVAWCAGRLLDLAPTVQAQGKITGAWPLPNVHVGVSAEDQQRWEERVPLLVQTPAAVRWVSAEPLLSAITPRIRLPQSGYELDPLRGELRGTITRDIRPASQIDWVVAGGESGNCGRPMSPVWARGLRDECQAAGVPFFFKQWGAWAPKDVVFDAGPQATTKRCPSTMAMRTIDGTVMLDCGKGAAGRMLDGRTWDELPRECNQADRGR